MRDELGRYKAVNGKKQLKKNEKNRYRNQIVNFHATPEERAVIETKAMLSGMNKGDYYIHAILDQKIEVIAGKYRSERLAVEIKKLREALENIHVDEDLFYLLIECKVLTEQFIILVSENPSCVDEANFYEFQKTIKKENAPAGNKDILE